jgi:hypothetical protein
MGSIKEMMVREYMTSINFKTDDWGLSKIKEDLRRLLGEEPAIDIVYKKDVMVNEYTGEAREFMDVNKVRIIFTDTDDHFKKIEFLIGDNIY